MHSRPRKLLRQIFGDHGRVPRNSAAWIKLAEASMAHFSKRSVIIGGQETSVSLEDGFWSALKEISLREGISVSALINGIAKRRQANLSSAIRTFVLDDARAHAAGDQAIVRRMAGSGHEEDCDTIN